MADIKHVDSIGDHNIENILLNICCFALENI